MHCPLASCIFISAYTICLCIYFRFTTGLILQSCSCGPQHLVIQIPTQHFTGISGRFTRTTEGDRRFATIWLLLLCSFEPWAYFLCLRLYELLCIILEAIDSKLVLRIKSRAQGS